VHNHGKAIAAPGYICMNFRLLCRNGQILLFQNFSVVVTSL
jgi:hypothetical protein